MLELTDYIMPPPTVNWLELASTLQVDLALTLAAVLLGLCGIIRELCDWQ